MFSQKFIITTVFLAFLLPFEAKAQFGFEYDPTIPVSKNGTFLNNPWAGGLDYTQFSTIDVDFDGDLDLFIFDRSADNIRVFLNETINGQQTWKYHYNASKLFPSDLMYRATTVDYNNDGKADLFTYSIGGLKVYKNIGTPENGLQWELVTPILYSNYNGFTSNLYVASSDIPAIVDVDADGDIDILTFHQGGQHLEYHRNMSMELFGNADSLKFELANECWGKFSENANNNSVTLNETSYPCENGNLPNPQLPPINHGNTSANTENLRHAGSTVLALDMDNSGTLDLILGDVAFQNLVYLQNGGTQPNTNSPMVSIDINFPSNTTPSNLYLFPAPFYLDVDFDGRKDLLVGANAKNVSQNETSILFYKNVGSTTTPTFSYQQNNFLQDQMIEHGKGTIPVIVDIDNDGKDDLLIANFYRYKNPSIKESTIAYYKNTGTTSNPSYTLIDYNWMNFDQSNYGLRLVPTFGDINGDGKKDMILGRENGTLVYYIGTGTNFSNPQTNFQDAQANVIQVGGHSFPQLVDLNEDGLLDLIVGSRTGKIWHYQNTGTNTQPSFTLISNNFGGAQVVDPNNPDGYAAPHFFKANNNWHLFLGGNDGQLRYYTGIEQTLQDQHPFNFIDENYLDLEIDAQSAYFIKDINNDGNLNLFAGTDMGGVLHFEANPQNPLSINTINTVEVVISPNPTNGKFTIKSTAFGQSNYTLYNIDGKLLKESYFTRSIQVDLGHYENGIYLLVIKTMDGNQLIRRVLKQ